MKEFHTIINNIKRYIDLSEEEEQALTEIIEVKRLKKRQFIVQPNFICQHQSYINQGALRSYFVTNEGIEHTIQFAIEDWFISDFNSYITQTPATLYIEALESSEILQIEYNRVENLCLDHPKFERFFRLVAQKAFAYSQKRVLSNLGKTAEERFKEFQTLYPSIVDRVPQYTLASYLGMTPEFLSKIRKQIS